MINYLDTDVTSHPTSINNNLILTIGNSSHQGTIGGNGEMYFSGSSSIYGASESYPAIIKKDVVAYDSSYHLKWVDFQTTFNPDNNGGTIYVDGSSDFQDVILNPTNTFILENSSNYKFDS